jgi:2-polyprenyl-3-methyl-5-hydroxy-6-metoxy-1,4-benzoquinol methylase
MITTTKCKICLSLKSKEILNVSKCEDTYLDYMKIDYLSFDRFYKECFECGLIYRSVYLDDNEKEQLYNVFRDIGLRKETHEQYFERITNLPSESSENIEKYTFLNKFLEKSGKHLDVGGGLGVFCFGFKKYFKNWDSICVEPTDGADVIARKNGVKSHNMYLTESSGDIIGKSFDLITANHVVEHVDNPIEFLIILKNFLNKNGMIYIEMPSTLDIGFLEISHDRFMCQHEVIYNQISVQNLAKKAGLEVFFIEDFLSKRGRNNVRALLR